MTISSLLNCGNIIKSLVTFSHNDVEYIQCTNSYSIVCAPERLKYTGWELTSQDIDEEDEDAENDVDEEEGEEEEEPEEVRTSSLSSSHLVHSLCKFSNRAKYNCSAVYRLRRH